MRQGNTQGGTQSGAQTSLPVVAAPSTPELSRNDLKDRIRKDVGALVRDAQNTAGRGEPAPDPDLQLITGAARDIANQFFVLLGVLLIGIPLARAIGRRIYNGAPAPGRTVDMAPQLKQLQESVDAMSIEVERISEGQRFTTKLLSSRAAAAVETRPG